MGKVNHRATELFVHRLQRRHSIIYLRERCYHSDHAGNSKAGKIDHWSRTFYTFLARLQGEPLWHLKVRDNRPGTQRTMDRGEGAVQVWRSIRNVESSQQKDHQWVWQYRNGQISNYKCNPRKSLEAGQHRPRWNARFGCVCTRDAPLQY